MEQHDTIHNKYQVSSVLLGGASEETELWPFQWFAVLLQFSLALNIRLCI